jgi:hypothetical protein
MQSAEQCRDCATEYKSLAMRPGSWLVLAGLLERLADIVEEEGE